MWHWYIFGFSKASDTVDCDIWLLKVKTYGIKGTELQWKNITNLIEDTMLHTVIINHPLELLHVVCHRVQNLIRRCFNIYNINDLSHVSGYRFSLSLPDDSKDIKVARNDLSKDLKNIQVYFNCNKLSLHICKKHYMIFTPRNKIVDDIHVQCCDNVMKRVCVTKFLGVQINFQLTWKTNVGCTCKTCQKYSNSF